MAEKLGGSESLLKTLHLEWLVKARAKLGETLKAHPWSAAILGITAAGIGIPALMALGMSTTAAIFGGASAIAGGIYDAKTTGAKGGKK
jgi:uncharacterized membrane protein HdeD (DUF308 family)